MLSRLVCLCIVCTGGPKAWVHPCLCWKFFNFAKNVLREWCPVFIPAPGLLQSVDMADTSRLEDVRRPHRLYVWRGPRTVPRHDGKDWPSYKVTLPGDLSAPQTWSVLALWHALQSTTGITPLCGAPHNPCALGGVRCISSQRP